MLFARHYPSIPKPLEILLVLCPKRIFPFVPTQKLKLKIFPSIFCSKRLREIVLIVEFRKRTGRVKHNLLLDYLHFLPHDIVRRRILRSAKYGGFQIYLRPVRFPGQYSCLLDNTDINNSLYVVLDNGKNKRFTVRE